MIQVTSPSSINSLSQSPHAKQAESCSQGGRTVKKFLIYASTLALSDLDCELNKLWASFLQHWGHTPNISQHWWNPVIQASNGAIFYLGALPITKKVFGKIVRNDADEIAKLGVKAVLSMTDLFENNYEGPYISSVVPGEWKKRNIVHMQIETPDFCAIALDKINEGVEFIHTELSQNHSVYGHCKAGRGRSAMVALGYLIKYHRMKAEQALCYLKKMRPQVHVAGQQWKAVKLYEENIKKGLTEF